MAAKMLGPAVLIGLFAGTAMGFERGGQWAPVYQDGAFAPGASSASEDPYYANCSQARAAGAAPLHRGEAGYRARLDRDGDGIACEPYRVY